MSIVALFAALPILAQSPVQEASQRFVDGRVAGADPAVSMCRFANYAANASQGKFVLNTNFWAKGIDFSCVSPWNGAAGGLRAGTAISKRHIIFAKHFPVWKGTRILFTDGDLGVCPCRVVETKEVPRTDIMIGLLDAELTPNITPAKVLPVDFGKTLTPGSRWPLVTFNQREEIFLSEIHCWSNRDSKAVQLWNRPAQEAAWKPFGGTIVVGDSGNPAFLLVGGQPILLYCLHTGGVGNGPKIHEHRFEIQSVMDDLCPGYKLEECRLGDARD